jgi:CBS domain-containing protein
MKAREVMTTPVVTVEESTPLRKIASLLLERGISAVPVVDAQGNLVGMVSEGDLVRPTSVVAKQRQDWWLEMLAAGNELSPDFLASIRSHDRTAKEVMTKDVISVGDDTSLAEIAQILEKHRIKRVPVVKDGKIVGIVSRANLLHTLLSED